MRHVFTTMGTVASLHVERELPRGVLDEVEAVVDRWDRTFSLYRADSPLSAIAAGRVDLVDAPAAVREEYARAVSWRAATAGRFTPHRPDGVLDLSGTVKAAAIAEAVEVLERAGATGMLGVGGDVSLLGAPRGPVIGVVDPDDRRRLLTALTLAGSRRAVATSGSAERGDHIWSAAGSTDIRQATVVADDIVTADVLATAIVAAGTAELDELTTAFDIDVLVVSATGLLATPGIAAAASASRRRSAVVGSAP